VRPLEATVARIDFGSVRVLSDDGRTYEATVPGRLRGARKALGNAVVTGDRVRLAWEGERAVVDQVEPRRNAFSRRASGEREEEQVVAANLDQVLVVAALVRPDFRHGLVDRVLVQCARAGIAAVVVLNKIDLDSRHEADSILAEYAHAGVEGLATCAVSGAGVDAVRDRCDGRRTLLVGHSGVGKSTLLHRLLPGTAIARAEVNEVTGKGRHTTTAAVLYRPAPGTELIDTPGVRAFALWGVDADDLVEYYPELKPHVGGCRFGDCRHDREPGCALRAAVERGEVGERRFASYCKLRDELAGGFH
jgi:ribosome biogenesis GTPase / thiamine phosphate phosphatase